MHWLVHLMPPVGTYMHTCSAVIIQKMCEVSLDMLNLPHMNTPTTSGCDEIVGVVDTEGEMSVHKHLLSLKVYAIH